MVRIYYGEEVLSLEMNGWSGNALLLRGLGGIVRVRLRVRVGLRCEELL